MRVYKEGGLTVVNGEDTFILSKCPHIFYISRDVLDLCFDYFWITPIGHTLKSKLYASYKALKYIWTDVRTPYGKG